MTLVPRSRRHRRRRRLSRAARAIRSAAIVNALVAAARRRRSLRLALRGSPLGALVASGGLVAVVVRRRRRRRRLEADLGPPNQSAPGYRVGPGTDTPPPATDVSAGPNEGAPGHEPERPS
jgi:hypothetical protein